MNINITASSVLQRLVMCGKINLEDLEREERVAMRRVYTSVHITTRYMRSDAEKRQYLKLLKIMASDIATMENSLEKTLLYDKFISYRNMGAEHGVVFEGFP